MYCGNRTLGSSALCKLRSSSRPWLLSLRTNTLFRQPAECHVDEHPSAVVQAASPSLGSDSEHCSSQASFNLMFMIVGKSEVQCALQTVWPCIAGVSHGIDLAVRHLARPGDQVLVEQPTYFLAGDILRQAGVKVVRLSGAALTQYGFVATGPLLSVIASMLSHQLTSCDAPF